MKKLNLGCGNNFHPDWTNIDFTSTGEGVIAHNLLSGIPFAENTYDAVYHSHVLEHFPKDKAQYFINECYRVLKPGGILRVAIPDLEQIARIYLEKLALASSGNKEAQADYEWIMLELLDQTVRNKSGGAMLEYLSRREISNEEFVYSRIGLYGKDIREQCMKPNHNAKIKQKGVMSHAWRSLKEFIKFKGRSVGNKYEEIGKFRLRGEIHQWMYDQYSLKYLLKNAGFSSVNTTDAFNSSITDYNDYCLDVKDGVIIKADSLFMEAKK